MAISIRVLNNYFQRQLAFSISVVRLLFELEADRRW